MAHLSNVSELLQCSGTTLALDTETTGLNPYPGKDKIIGLGFYSKEKESMGYIPTLDEASRREVYEAVSKLSADTTLIFHNAKFDLHFLHMDPRKWTVMDTTILVHLLDSRDKKALKDAETKYLGTDSKRAHLAAAPARTKIWDFPLDLVSSYCANDCLVTYQLAEKLYPMQADWGLTELFWKDMEYMKTVYDIEAKGVLLDENFVIRSQQKLESRILEMQEQLWDSTGGNEFNWRSPQQLSRAIYDGLGIQKPKNPFADADGIDRSRFAMGGKYKSTCTSTFILTEKIHHPLGSLISSIREADKIRKAYLKWMELQDANHFLHTSFNQSGTRTGRLSSSRPNLQNIASNTRGRFTQSVYTGSVERTDEYNMRRAIIAREGHCYLSVDYKQMEMRMFGILSKDPFMLAALIAGKDVHLEIALKVWGDCGYDINMVHREWSKTITFGLIYGMTIGSLQYKLNMTRFEAAKITDQYWAQFPRIKPWMGEIVDSCRTFEYLRYWSGRLWREEDVVDMYKGCNALIQGGCADLLSIAAMRVDKWCHEQGPEYFMINLVHDETITEVPLDEIIRSARNVGTIMQVPDLLDIPFATDCKVGRGYGDMEKINKDWLKDETVAHKSIEDIFAYAEASNPAGKSAKSELGDEEDDEEEEEEEVEA